MLKFVFWILLGLNAALFAYGQGLLGKFKGDEHEPARIKNQLAAGKLTPMTAAQAQASAASVPAPAPAAPAEAPAPSAPAQPLACAEVGTFGAGDARRFEGRLAKLDLGERQSRLTVPAQEVTSYLVHIPPLGSKEAAERRAAELRGLGVENLFVMAGESPLKWAISLGVFKSQTAAQGLLASLNKQGVRDARIYPRGPLTNHFVYRFRDIDAATRARIVDVADAFDAAQVKSCR